MALVRRTTAVGRAPVPGSAAIIPAQGGGSAPASTPGLELAAAVASKPASGWALAGALALTTLGGVGAWNINQLAPPTTFQVGNQMTTFLALFVFAAAVERVLEPFSRFMPGRSEQAAYERAVADLDNGVPGAMHAAAHYKAALDSARASRALIMWGLATLVATVLSAAAGFYLLRLISADSNWHGVSTWIDALVTGLVVGSGTKPLHDGLVRIQGSTNSPTSV